MNQFEEDRRVKLAIIREMGIDPFPPGNNSNLTPIKRVRALYDPSFGKHDGPYFLVCGRILLRRGHGKLGFLTLISQDANIQIALDHSRLSEKDRTFIKHLDLGDVIVCGGKLGRTDRGEITIWADEITIVSKSLLPPPDKVDGLSNIETRYRERHLDLRSPEVFKVMKERSAIIAAIREFLIAKKGYIEVETPILQTSAGGAAAKPFMTHHNALKRDLFLRIAPELYLKRLIVGGFEKVFEIGKNFRNEGIDASHNPEFTSLEAYEVQGNCETMMKLVEEMVWHVFWSVYGVSGEFTYKENVINIKPPWQKVELKEITARAYPDEKYSEFEERIQPTRMQPLFVVGLPAKDFPLAKNYGNGYSRVFELTIGGMEIGAGYTEEADPDEQLKAFKEQSKDGHVLDEDFVEVLKCGMPPTGGIGIGIDRLVSLFTNQHNIKDVTLFPILRQE